MKAVILLAGVGSRLHPLTHDTPKSLLPIGDSTILEHMITKLQKHGITAFVIVCGHMREKIQEYIRNKFPDLDVSYVVNEKYLTTNTGYSLLRAEHLLADESFIKLDGDVIFDEEILKRLLSGSDEASYVCTDNTSVNEEVIKVICDENGVVFRIGNKLPVAESIGESIGIERISHHTSVALFEALRVAMADESKQQDYYESSYDVIIQAGSLFKSVDITGLAWVETDNLEDYNQAIQFFAKQS